MFICGYITNKDSLSLVIDIFLFDVREFYYFLLVYLLYHKHVSNTQYKITFMKLYCTHNVPNPMIKFQYITCF